MGHCLCMQPGIVLQTYNLFDPIMHFGHKIIIAFVLFISFIVSMVFAMVRTKVDLVKEDYYEDEATFKQNQLILKNSHSAQEAFAVEKSILYSILAHHFHKMQQVWCISFAQLIGI